MIRYVGVNDGCIDGCIDGLMLTLKKLSRAPLRPAGMPEDLFDIVATASVITASCAISCVTS